MAKRIEDLETYLVGGAVRDELMGLKPHDEDYVVVGSTPEEMAALGFIPVGKDFPVFLHPTTHKEHALARSERKVAKGYKGFVFNTDPSIGLEEDLMRRDLTINAMAKDAKTGEIIDPYGGQEDLRNGILRHVSDAFKEDPVRILRLAKFGARYSFKTHPDTMKLMREMVAMGEVDALVPERVFQETKGALMAAKPSIFFEILHEVGALPKLFPELAKLREMEVPPNKWARWPADAESSTNPPWEKATDLANAWVLTMRRIDLAAKLGLPEEARYALLVIETPATLPPSKDEETSKVEGEGANGGSKKMPGHNRKKKEPAIELLRKEARDLRVPASFLDCATRALRHYPFIRDSFASCETTNPSSFGFLGDLDALVEAAFQLKLTQTRENLLPLLDMLPADPLAISLGEETIDKIRETWLKIADLLVNIDFSDIYEKFKSEPMMIQPAMRERSREALQGLLRP